MLQDIIAQAYDGYCHRIQQLTVLGEFFYNTISFNPFIYKKYLLFFYLTKRAQSMLKSLIPDSI